MKLVTWNTQACTGLDAQVRPDRIVDAARALADFDLLCLQEIAVGFPALTGGRASDQPAQLAALLPGFRLFFGPAVDAFDADGLPRRFGNLIASRLPVLQVRHHALPFPPDDGAAGMPRMCTAVVVRDAALGLVRVMTTHLEFYSDRQRLAQAAALKDLGTEYAQQARGASVADAGSAAAAECRTDASLLCGDFNCTPGSAGYRTLTSGSRDGAWHDAWIWLHGASPQPPTFCVHEQRYLPQPTACDFVFASEPLARRLRRCEIDAGTRASDHQPVLVEFG